MLIINNLWKSYLFYLKRADPRVEDWLLMKNYWPTLAITLLYLFSVAIGTKIMKSRSPIPCQIPLVFYNLFLVFLNFHIFYELIISSSKLGYSYLCQPVNYTDNPDELRVARALHLYYLSKMIEFLDTIFFILRKKNTQITFLHVYHHATMFPIWWIGIKWVPGGQSFFGALINSFVHVTMYLYYFLSSLGPSFHRFLFWKKYLTKLQLIQFIIGMIHAGQSLYFSCPFPKWMQWALIIYGFSIMILFINFYYKTYCKQTVTKGNRDVLINDKFSSGDFKNNGLIKRKSYYIN